MLAYCTIDNFFENFINPTAMCDMYGATKLNRQIPELLVNVLLCSTALYVSSTTIQNHGLLP